jgi:hypothetical protein
MEQVKSKHVTVIMPSKEKPKPIIMAGYELKNFCGRVIKEVSSCELYEVYQIKDDLYFKAIIRNPTLYH